MRNTSVFSNFSQRDYRYSTNTKFTVRRTNTYTHTYIRTDTGRVQHVNVGLAQARPNYLVLQANTKLWWRTWNEARALCVSHSGEVRAMDAPAKYKVSCLVTLCTP